MAKTKSKAVPEWLRANLKNRLYDFTYALARHGEIGGWGVE